MTGPDHTEKIKSEGAQDGADAVTVVADTREPQRLRLLSLDHPDVDKWMESELAAADFVVNGIGFERKTPEDFASSLLEGRLDEQVEKLGDAYDHAYILLEGVYSDFDDLQHTRLKAQSARGKAASITARHGIPVMPCLDDGTLIDMAVRLGRKHTEEPTSAHLPTGAVGSSEPSGKRMWACLPNVGPTMAERLFDEFGSPTTWNWGGPGDDGVLDSLCRVDGIGEKTAETILDALRGQDV